MKPGSLEAIASRPDQAGLVRSLSLPLAVLFGLGVTIGAGIYVLIGATARRAGMHTPIAFLLAALVMAPTAASFAEFSSRMPVSAGEAAYVGAVAAWGILQSVLIASAMTVIEVAGLVAVVFIGFEGLANIAEEVKDPKRNLPRAILLTLVVSTFFYIIVVWIALISVP